ncbi:YchE family NAAT transporter [Buchnera aphidicola (Ceratoglyphina bambusae)]|uniref:YchE family NAAT transporter n=1 Tax=Buchnera aphidicola TaxID=9 RepID=UPI0031B868E4
MYLKLFDIALYINFFFNLFILINPIGMIPVFINITKNQNHEERKKTNFIVNITVFLILLLSLFFGLKILNLFGISIHSLRITGGILIINMAMSIINDNLFIKKNNLNKKNNTNISKNISIVPLATPLIAGPGVISSIIIWSSNNNDIYSLIVYSIVITIFSYFCWMLFNMSNLIINIFGFNGIDIITKIMGLLLMSIGIELLTTEIKFLIYN